MRRFSFASLLCLQRTSWFGMCFQFFCHMHYDPLFAPCLALCFWLCVVSTYAAILVNYCAMGSCIVFGPSWPPYKTVDGKKVHLRIFCHLLHLFPPSSSSQRYSECSPPSECAVPTDDYLWEALDRPKRLTHHKSSRLSPLTAESNLSQHDMIYFVAASKACPKLVSVKLKGSQVNFFHLIIFTQCWTAAPKRRFASGTWRSCQTITPHSSQ